MGDPGKQGSQECQQSHCTNHWILDLGPAQHGLRVGVRWVVLALLLREGWPAGGQGGWRLVPLDAHAPRWVG